MVLGVVMRVTSGWIGLGVAMSMALAFGRPAAAAVVEFELFGSGVVTDSVTESYTDDDGVFHPARPGDAALGPMTLQLDLVGDLTGGVFHLSSFHLEGIDFWVDALASAHVDVVGNKVVSA